MLGGMTASPYVTGWDATSANLSQAPVTGQPAGYITGSPGIVWTELQMAAHPGFIQIDQSPANTAADVLADVADYEAGAVLLADIIPWLEEARAAYNRGTRPGQRVPAVYLSESSIPSVVAYLVTQRYTTPVPMWVAHWGLTLAQAEAKLAANPTWVGVQYSDNGGGAYDSDVWRASWVDHVSHAPVEQPPRPLGAYQRAILVGTGANGATYEEAWEAGMTTWAEIPGAWPVRLP